ncbi:SH3 domain-containing protein [Pedobacter westerhofensis]|uniref:SH3 domain-containing protein n=1 Tax=Pedobacter westerhofensis TaxID=425512 RepID=A0A521FPB6_9SPHI|nr:C40 family peptidase [Pedobacter westerhofensis]SMO98012.1 SH3 domain-containing protein [Pedobacter westerhofensis]
MEQKFAICRVAIAPLRPAASDRAEISTQLLFGDAVEVLEQAEPWWRIRNAYDDYEGWMDFKQLIVVTEEDYRAAQNYHSLVPPQIVNAVTAADGSAFYLPAAAVLPSYAEGMSTIGDQQFKPEFDLYQVGAVTGEKIAELAMFYLNAPYLWGGRTLFGIDCSGFSQAVYKLAGIRIKRDAAQQAEQGETVNFLPEVKTGDLAFFDNPEGRIIHVGILLDQHRIIHASGRIRIDPIDDQGIYNPELGRYSHKTRIIKRFF